jgi:hypothetical protein
VAQQALPPGALRRRAVLGLLDADGWTWATLRALFWFLLIVFMLGYIPNLAYFFTVSNTVKVGYNFASIVNWCPAVNEDLPCPAPAGALLPWQGSPVELALPAAREEAVTFQSGTTLYLIGGATADGATAEVLVTEATTTDDQPNGNLSSWTVGPALPEPRASAAVGVFSGVPYVIGGLDAAGAPTDTVFQGVVEAGVLTGWQLANGEGGTPDLTLPRPISDAAVEPGTAGFALIGGRDAEGQPIDDVYVAWIPEDQASPSNTLQPWAPLEGLPLPEARAGAVSGTVGSYTYVVGGEGPDGPTDSVFRLELVNGRPATDESGAPLGWAVAQSQLLPEARADAAGFVANGAVYVMGGLDASGQPQDSVYWVVPDTTTGDLTGGWQRLDQTDLAQPIASAPIAGLGSTAFIFGGRDADGPADSLQRAGLSPQAPFYQLGLFGATLPGLAIKGEVGQQLGYMNAMGAGMLNFAILVLIGLAFSHQATTKRIISRLSGGRIALPPEEEYRV